MDEYSIYKQLVKRMAAREKEVEDMLDHRESFLTTVEGITGQSRKRLPDPKCVSTVNFPINAPYNSPYWSVTVEEEVEFQQYKNGTVFVVLQPSVCSKRCQGVIKTPADLEALIRRHLFCGENHQPLDDRN